MVPYKCTLKKYNIGTILNIMKNELNHILLMCTIKSIGEFCAQPIEL